METNQPSWKQINYSSKPATWKQIRQIRKRRWLIRITSNNGNKPTLMVTKHKQKEMLAYYGNKSTAAAMKFMTETRNRKRRWIVMETDQLRIRQVNVSKLSNL
jgi:hypothetical protein